MLAIFAVNVKMMANGYNHYDNVAAWEGGGSKVIGELLSWFVHGKFVTIFTALFGAGLVLLLDREDPIPLPIVLKRLLWLMVFGGVHLIFLREGDILIWYALAGFLAVFFVKLNAPVLFAVGVGLHVLIFIYFRTFASLPDAPTLWSEAPDAHEAAASIMLGPVSGHIAARLEAARYYMIDLYLVGGVWVSTLATMVFGMAFLKTGFLSGKLLLRSYVLWGAVGLGIASVIYLIRPILEEDEGVRSLILSMARYSHPYGGALAWSALIVGAVVQGWRGARLAAVGRTAFTVYILQSVIGLLLFSSLGLGLFGQLSLRILMIVTLTVWAFFLIAAPLWLSHFRFGPLEWLWRSLTYGRAQQFRR